MPKQIFDAQTILSMLDKAEKVVVVKRKESAKLKLRVGKYLYTYAAAPDEVDKLVSSVKDKSRVVNY
ncbi:MAG: hypothetical protein M1291_01295 [Thaumarchaeota archaeon]|jgi:uncharacterized Fe-S center protein|nr:hypothetical protein [Nitrososphaerota archaeon]